MYDAGFESVVYKLRGWPYYLGQRSDTVSNIYFSKATNLKTWDLHCECWLNGTRFVRIKVKQQVDY